ncbi:hypothetical protein SAMN02910264_00270 [Ruminococcaceae bacterium YAD3003]|nr:hypothetical protein SAMN02910264_00270 [Ruminococcaceae bacterium YAD3003]
MKITPAKNYKKPLYAIGIAAALSMTAMATTGCIGYAGGLETTVQETEETQKDGTVDGKTNKTYCKPDGDDVVLAGDVRLEGEATVETEVELDGDVIVNTNPVETDVRLDGGVSIDEG